MSITTSTAERVRAMRVTLDAAVDDALRINAQAWAVAWGELASEFTAAVDELVALAADGDWPTRAQIHRTTRASKALRHAAQRLEELTAQAGVSATGTLDDIIRLADEWERGLALTQMPPGVGISWDRIPPDALDAIVQRTTQRIGALSMPIPEEQTEALNQVLIRGVAIGENPREAARELLNRLGGNFDGGRMRAETIMRTEILDALRRAALASRLRNKDVLNGWVWHCDLSERTCPACLAMNGTRFPLDQPGPEGHPNCRCVAVPQTKTWRELGFDVDEPADVTRDARDWFDNLPQEARVKIMGRERLRRLDAGELRWEDIPRRVENPDWRPSYGVAPLRQAA